MTRKTRASGPDVLAAIAAKRDGREISPPEWHAVIEGFVSGEVPDYQMSALLMAVVIRGMSASELRAVTEAMVRSGRRLDLSDLAPVVDKHSTGGVGDKTTLVVAPMVAACGVRVAKMSGCGLGHTGGTIDKLASIPGMMTEIAPSEFLRQVEKVGVAVIAQREDLAPADKELYALRDVTATVESIPLIAASVVSKKVAGGARAVVFDVKSGRGAFMRTLKDARRLGTTMVELARFFGLRSEAILTAMDEPLGRAVGNALEVAEAVRTLQGEGPPDLVEVCVTLARRMLSLGAGLSVADAELRVRGALAGGEALEVFRRWVAAQGGDPRVADRLDVLPAAPVRLVLRAEQAGVVAAVDSLVVGRVAGRLGAARAKKGDEIDPAVGVVCEAKVGESVTKGAALATVHARNRGSARRAIVDLRGAWRIAQEASCGPVVLEDPLITGEGADD